MKFCESIDETKMLNGINNTHFFGYLQRDVPFFNIFHIFFDSRQS